MSRVPSRSTAPASVGLHGRRPGDPSPDPLPLRVAHRAIRADLQRLTGAADELVTGAPLPPARAKALARYVELFCDSVHHHHTLEDDVLWPVLAGAAGAALDLHELQDDHAALDDQLDALRRSARGLVTAGRRTRDAGGTAALGAFASAVTGVAALLEEHMSDEDATVLPAIERYLSVEQWAEVERQAGKSKPDLGFELPRIVDVTTPEEFATLTAALPRLLVRVARLVAERPFRRRQRLAFGS